MEDLIFLLNNFSGFEDSSMFELVQNFEVLSTILQACPERFGGSLMSLELAQALRESNIFIVDSYFEEFQMLSKVYLAEKILFYSLENDSNIDLIYHVLKKAKGLKESKNDLIQFLLDNDIRNESITAEYIEKAKCKPLVSAARHGSLELTKALLSKGLNVNEFDWYFN